METKTYKEYFLSKLAQQEEEIDSLNELNECLDAIY